MSTASIADRLADLGSARWAIHFEARRRVAAGQDIVELTIGEPDIPTPVDLIEVAYESMRAGRTGYAGGRGEKILLDAIVDKYVKRSGRQLTHENVFAFPGTQAALSICMLAMVEEGDAVLVPDPCYATYEAVVRATGADFVPVPMSPDNGFCLTVEQLEKAVVPNARVLLLNSPHNPTGAVLDDAAIAAIGQFCRKHNLWILSDEVYEDLIYGKPFASPFDNDALAEITVAASSISKSHAAPGFRSGWAVGPGWFMTRMQAVAESVLFGNQPFIADMTAHALSNPGGTSAQMAVAYQRRIGVLLETFADCSSLGPLRPDSGMFMVIDVSGTGLDGNDFARRLLDFGVAVMPGDSFGNQARNFIRLSLTVEDEVLRKAAQRIVRCTQSLSADGQQT
ncbi:MAG: pyridoxal phosphate-dependent aminotransferase [Rhizobiaceae bacterium]